MTRRQWTAEQLRVLGQYRRGKPPCDHKGQRAFREAASVHKYRVGDDLSGPPREVVEAVRARWVCTRCGEQITDPATIRRLEAQIAGGK